MTFVKIFDLTVEVYFYFYKIYTPEYYFVDYLTAAPKCLYRIGPRPILETRFSECTSPVIGQGYGGGATLTFTAGVESLARVTTSRTK